MSRHSQQADLIIIGGGILGAFHAYHALQRGLSVILLERHAAPQGATVRNFGQVVPSGLNLHWQHFGRESLRIYKELQAHRDISVSARGSIYLASNDEELTLLEELRQINLAHDYPSDPWTAQQCLARYPTLRSDYCRGGLFFPEEVSVNPRVLIHRIHQYLTEQPNYDSHFDTCVSELNGTGEKVTAKSTDGRIFQGAKVILCCGNEFQTLYPALFRASDLAVVKLQMLRLKPQLQVPMPGNILTNYSIRRYESFSQCPSWTEIKSREPANSFAKQWGVHVLFKQETDGGIILGDSHAYTPASSMRQLDFDLRNDINEFFIAEGRKIFDLPSWEIEVSWFGIYSQTAAPTGIFQNTIDNHIHVVTGIGGKGMTSSPGFAKHSLQEIFND